MYDKELASNMSTLVKDTLDSLYKFYSKGVPVYKEGGDGRDSSKDVVLDEKKHKREKANLDSKSDLERYLAEDIVEENNDGEFNILDW